MGLMGFLRKNKRNKSANKGSKKKGAETAAAVEEGPTILPELPEKIVEHTAHEGTNSTEPESTHHEGDDIVREDNITPYPPPPIPSAEPIEKEAEESSSSSEPEQFENEPEDSDSSSAFEIVESPQPELPSPTEIVTNESSKPDSPKDETSILEKFKAKSPVRRGNTVAARAEWLQNSAFKDDNNKNNKSPESSPVSHENARAKKMFWEGKTFHKETSNAPDPPSVRHRTDVMAKKKWLETVAFTPSGGGNMASDNTETVQTPERRKYTIGLLPASPVTSGSNDEEGRGRTAKLMEAIDSYDKQTTGDVVYLDKDEDPYEWAYEVWFKKGLLRWQSSSFAEDGVPVYSTVRADVLSPASTRSWDSASPDRIPKSPKKYLTGSPLSSTGMESVPEQEQASFGKEGDDSKSAEPRVAAAVSTENESFPDIATELGSSSSPSLPIGPEHDIVASDSSMQSGDDNNHEDSNETSEGLVDESDEKVKALFELQQKMLREAASDVTPPISGEEGIDTTGGTDYNTSEDILDETDEEMKGLFELQQRILDQFRQEKEDGFVMSGDDSEDEDLGQKAVEVYAPPPQISGGAEQAKDGEKTTDDEAQSTDSSEKLRLYSKQYFVEESESRDFSADGESGVHLEPSIMTNASSITVEDNSVGDALLFMNSSFDAHAPDSSKDVAASFELMDEMQFQSEMSAASDARGRVLSWQKDHHFEANRSPSKDHAPSQPSRKVSTQGSNLCPPPITPENQQRTSPADHAPEQPFRQISVEGQDLLPLDPDHRTENHAAEVVVTAAASRTSDHAPEQPTRKISVDNLGLAPLKEDDIRCLKQDTAPITPVRVASLEAISPLYTSESLKKLRAKKIATAIRGEYVMWLTRSRRITFRKSAEAPALSWFSDPSDSVADVKEEDKKPVLIPFVSVPPRLQDKFRPALQREMPAIMSPKLLTRVIEDAEKALEMAELEESQDERESSFEDLKQDLRNFISPSRRKAMGLFESAKKKKMWYMRRAFGMPRTKIGSLSKQPEEQEATNSKAAAELRQKLTQIPAPNDDDIQAIFEVVDCNGDGSLSMKEVEKAMIQRKEQFNLPPTIIMRAFQKTDSNGNGAISRDEFFHFIRCINYFQNLQAIFEEMDKDGNRRLSREEFVQAARVLNVDADHAADVFDDMDENSGGYVCFDEFCLWMGEKRALEDVAREAGSTQADSSST